MTSTPRKPRDDDSPYMNKKPLPPEWVTKLDRIISWPFEHWLEVLCILGLAAGTYLSFFHDENIYDERDRAYWDSRR